MSEILGTPDSKSTSRFLKIFIQEPKSGVTVAGKIGEGTSLEIVSNTTQPFESESAAALQKAGGLFRELTSRTFKTAIQTRQVWQGNQPYSFNVVLKLKAEHNAVKEVEEPIKTIERWMAPDVNAVFPGFGGREPNMVILTVGNRIIKDCIITQASIPQDQLRTKDGHLVKAEINMTIQTIQMLTKSDLAGK